MRFNVQNTHTNQKYCNIEEKVRLLLSLCILCTLTDGTSSVNHFFSISGPKHRLLTFKLFYIDFNRPEVGLNASHVNPSRGCVLTVTNLSGRPGIGPLSTATLPMANHCENISPDYN
jgi:hypothetical protein